MKKPFSILLAGHLMAVVLGIALALALRPNPDRPGPVTDQAGSSRTSGNRDSVGRQREARPSRVETGPRDSATLKAAWKLMQSQSRGDRERLRPRLLAEWAGVDLEGALEAALIEPDSSSLLPVFDGLFDKDPTVFEPLMEGERFGLKSAELRGWWIGRMGSTDPDALFSMVSRFNASDQEKIVKVCADGMAPDPAKLWGMIDGLVSLPDTPANRRLWVLAANAITTRQGSNAVVEKLSALKGPVGDVMISAAMAVMLDRTDYAGARATYDSLPADLKPQIVEAALKAPGKNVAAYLAALDEVINAPDWTKLQKPLAVKLHEMSPSSQQYPVMLDWASRLPERDDTMDIYRVAVRRFVTYQPEQARQWIGAMPAGWKRQNSLTAYVQSALFGRGDVEGANWAIPQIVDPRFRAEADGFLRSYQERKQGK